MAMRVTTAPLRASRRWQLHQAGRDEESTCRFCHQPLQDWRPVITTATGSKWVTLACGPGGGGASGVHSAGSGPGLTGRSPAGTMRPAVMGWGAGAGQAPLPA